MAEVPWDEYPETRVWLATKKNKWSYWRPFKRFMQIVGVSTPLELLEVPEDEARRRLADFRDLNADHYATKTTNLYSTSITSFFDRHGKDVRVKRIRQYVAKSYKAFTQADIRTLVKYADMRTKAIIHCCYSSGARISSILGLKVSRIAKGTEPPVELGFYATETKYNVRYTTFLSAEALEAIELYLAERKRKDEEITSDSLLFVNKYGKQLTANAAGAQLHLVIDRSGVTYDKEHERVGNHCFRNAFQRNLQRAGVNQAVIELLMGHSQNSTHQRYTIGHTPEELREAHMKADWSLGESVMDEIDDLRNQLQAIQKLLPENVIRAYTNARIPLGESKPVHIPTLPITSISASIPPSSEEHMEIIRGEVNRLTDSYTYEAKQVDKEELVPLIEQGWEVHTKLSEIEYIVRRKR